jgi:hypothetical protein
MRETQGGSATPCPMPSQRIAGPNRAFGSAASALSADQLLGTSPEANQGKAEPSEAVQVRVC